MTLCHYAECHCSKCRDLFIVMLNVVMLSVGAPQKGLVFSLNPTHHSQFDKVGKQNAASVADKCHFVSGFRKCEQTLHLSLFPE